MWLCLCAGNHGSKSFAATKQPHESGWPLKTSSQGIPIRTSVASTMGNTKTGQTALSVSQSSKYGFDLEDLLESDVDFIQEDLSFTHTAAKSKGSESSIVKDGESAQLGTTKRDMSSDSYNNATQNVTQRAVSGNMKLDHASTVASSTQPIRFAQKAEEDIALSTKTVAQHVRIHIAALPEKYNVDPLEAIFGLGNEVVKKASS